MKIRIVLLLALTACALPACSSPADDLDDPSGSAATSDELVSTGGCKYELAETILSGTLPPLHELRVVRTACPTPGSFRVTAAYAIGERRLVPMTRDRAGRDRLLVLYKEKASPSGSALFTLNISQIDDGLTGKVVRRAEPWVGGFEPKYYPLAVPLTELHPEVTATGHLHLWGTGAFPGSTGKGARFYATWIGFTTRRAGTWAADEAVQE